MKYLEGIKWYNKGKFNVEKEYLKEGIKWFNKVNLDIEEDDIEETPIKYKIGDYVTIIRTPDNTWLNDSIYKTFKLIGEPTYFKMGLAWCTDGTEHLNDDSHKFGIPEDWFRLATKEEINREYGKYEGIKIRRRRRLY
jgi:hypothetical protein